MSVKIFPRHFPLSGLSPPYNAFSIFYFSPFSSSTANPYVSIMNLRKTVSITNTKVTTTQSDSLRTNITDNIYYPDSLTANISQPVEVTTRTSSTWNDTQTHFSVNSNSVHSNPNNSKIFNSVQNQHQIPRGNSLTRSNHAHRYNPIKNNTGINQNQVGFQNENFPNHFTLNIDKITKKVTRQFVLLVMMLERTKMWKAKNRI